MTNGERSPVKNRPESNKTGASKASSRYRRVFFGNPPHTDVYSLNVPVPADVARLAGDVARELPEARARTRNEHTLVAKRLGDGIRETFDRLAARTREALAGQPAFEARVTGVEYFSDAVSGTSPVVYLAVESPGLVALHHELAETFEPVEAVEGEAYVPHVTVARGGSPAAADRIAQREIDAIDWTVSELRFWDAKRAQSAGTVSLPA